LIGVSGMAIQALGLGPQRDEAIMRAALEGLADLGYDLLSMEEIATRARVGKGALYRRWSSKAELIVDAMLRWREQWAPISPPDTGSLLGDIDAMIAQVPDFDETAQRQIAVLLGLLSAAPRDAALQQALADSGFGRPANADFRDGALSENRR
jgi:AcrR family transcriptional regulator